MTNNRYFPLFYRRYVDDTFAVFKTKRSAMQFFDFINTLHPNIKFTMECEKDGKISFLDTVVNKDRDKFLLNMYRKPTFTGLYTHWSSLIPLCYKIGLVKSLLNRAYCICSNWSFLSNEFEYIKGCLIKNGFPTSIINKCTKEIINKFRDKSTLVQPDTINVSKLKLFLKLPFLGSDSIELKRNVLNLVSEYSKALDLRIVFKSASTIGAMFPYKDKMPRTVKSHIVYKIQCEACSVSYVGKTIQCLANRNARGLSGGEYHAFKEHAKASGTNHTYKIEDVEILASAENDYKLCIKESLLIKYLNPPLCKNKLSVPIRLF